MINVPTVLVLGAGASTHCGYPLGVELIARLCSLRGSTDLDNLPNGWNRNDVEIFLTRLSRSGHYSIDAFLETNRDHASLGKYLITYELKKHELIDKMFPPNNSGWYQYLFNSLLVDGKPNFAANKIGIITFNYDRSLEAYLHAALQNRFQIDSSKAESILNEIPIVHVHGILGKYPAISYDNHRPTAEILEISQQIQIIHEISDKDENFCNEMFQKSYEMLLSADKIFFLGFGFHPDNMRRFRFFTAENVNRKTLSATCPSMYPLEKEDLVKKLSAFGFTKDTLSLDGSSCNDFFRRSASLE